ncbi:Ral Guanine Nucleotide Dissociation Stimulator [Manis pentadactyla]|nr:Ral Guanine Nucleotide Dissociation Stimulator [Manis pentadactyla]
MALKCYVVYHVIVSSDPTNPQGNSKTRAIISEFGFLVDIRKVLLYHPKKMGNNRVIKCKIPITTSAMDEDPDKWFLTQSQNCDCVLLLHFSGLIAHICANIPELIRESYK